MGIDVALCVWHKSYAMTDTNPVKHYRDLTGLSQSALAAKLGVDQSTISRAEREPNPVPLPKAAGLLLDLLIKTHKPTKRREPSGVAA